MHHWRVLTLLSWSRISTCNHHKVPSGFLRVLILVSYMPIEYNEVIRKSSTDHHKFLFLIYYFFPWVVVWSPKMTTQCLQSIMLLQLSYMQVLNVGNCKSQNRVAISTGDHFMVLLQVYVLFPPLKSVKRMIRKKKRKHFGHVVLQWYHIRTQNRGICQKRCLIWRFYMNLTQLHNNNILYGIENKRRQVQSQWRRWNPGSQPCQESCELWEFQINSTTPTLYHEESLKEFY
jgi:hypothetical protein